MPPKTNSVDGISKTAVAPQPAPPDQNLSPSQNSDVKPVATAPNAKPKDSIPTTKNSNSQTVVIVITIVIMVVLIALAVLAYHKSS